MAGKEIEAFGLYYSKIRHVWSIYAYNKDGSALLMARGLTKAEATERKRQLEIMHDMPVSNTK